MYFYLINIDLTISLIINRAILIEEKIAISFL